MKTVTRQSNATKGIAKILVGESKVRVTFKDEDGNYEDGEQFKFSKDDVPDYVKSSGEFYATVSGDGQSLLGLRPVKGAFKTKFSHFLSKQDEPPAPIQREGKYGPYLTFIAILRITADEYKGMEIPVSFVYKFVETDDELTAVEVGNKKGNSGERLMDFLEAAGVGDAQIKFSDNVLPRLQKALLSTGAEFVTALKDGQAEYFMESLSPKVEDDDEDEAPRKSKNGKNRPPWDGDDDEPKAKVLKPVIEDDDDEKPVKKSKKSNELDAFDD